MIWVLVGAAWLVLALLVALLIGRAVRIADERAAATEANFVVDPAAPAPGATADPSALEPTPTYDTPTVPGIPVARPSAAPGKIIPRRQMPPPARRSESA